MEKKRYLSITLAMCLVFSILSGCGGQAAQSPQTQAAGDAKEESRQDGTAGESPEDTANQASGDTILIGVSGSITGAAPINGLRTKQGAQMAADEINAAGGVLGRQIELFVADDGGAQDTAINAANLIISQDVAAQVGPCLLYTSISTPPLSRRTISSMALRVVDLPAPFSPISPMMAPFGSKMSTSFREKSL